jgi:hypothetical protein
MSEGKRKSPSLDLEKIHQEITKRDKDANKAKELLSFLIAVEAVEKSENPKTGGDIEFILPEAVAKLLDGNLDLKLTDSTGAVSDQQAKTVCFTVKEGPRHVQDTKTVCVTVKEGNLSDDTQKIDGEFYQEKGIDKWRPWWRSSTSTNQGGEWKIPVPPGWPDKPNQDKLDPDNPASKCVIFLRDILGAETSKYICPWSEELLMEITKGSGKLVYTKTEKLKLDDDKLSFNLWGVPTIDHLVPQSIGGENHTNNLLTVSQRANFAKGNFFPLDPKSWETRESYKVACKEAANSPATFLEVMRNYIVHLQK